MSSLHPPIRTVGVPVRSVNWVWLFATHDAAGRECLVAVMGQQADNLMVVLIDLERETIRQFSPSVPESNYPTAAMRSADGTVYIGAAHSGHLLRFDPRTEQLEDLGAINPPADIFPCRIDEDADGVLWIGCYGSAGLTSFNPRTTTFTRHGRMDEVDMYCYPWVAPDELIACEIRMTTPHIEVFDPRTGEHRTVGPVVSKEAGGAVSLFRSTDGNLYIRSSQGNFRLDGFNAVPVDSLPDPEPAPTLADGSTFAFADAASQMYRTMAITNPRTGAVRQFRIDYHAAGSSIFLLHRGPDDALYGSSVLPLHLFRYTPRTDELVDLGVCSVAAGEAYSMGNLDGLLYICAYPYAELSIYDPSRPYQFGQTPESNPRDVGRMDDISYRPRSMLTGPLGRVWTASIPDYGLWGGPLSWYDPRTQQFGTYRDIAGDASCWTLAWLEVQRLIAVGTSIGGGTGTRPRATQAGLFLWDYDHEEKVWEGTLDRTVHAINALLCGPDGNLYGTVVGGEQAPELFIFDPQNRVFLQRLPLPPGGPLELGLQVGPDGLIYGFTRSCLYRFDPADRRLTEVVRSDGAFQVAGPIIGDTIYFGNVHELFALKLF